MRILSIETSCDETAVSIIETAGDFPHATYTVLGNGLFSQIDIHREYGGVFPAVAKREHAKTLVPMLERALEEAGLLLAHDTALSTSQVETLQTTLFREPGLGDALIAFFEKYQNPAIDLVAVTNGPGLEPTLWVGINFARTLSTIWNIPVIPINHMEGHILASLFQNNAVTDIAFPALALLISGGHTELVLMKTWGSYEKIGETRDDAVGEAFDKVARMLGLPYPGGPEIGTRARSARERSLPEFTKLPRPMLEAPNFDFSFSGLKTAVRYAIQNKVDRDTKNNISKSDTLTEDERDALARDFEDAVAEVLLKKAVRAIDAHGIQTLIIGGGVSANTYLRETFTTFLKTQYPHVSLFFPSRNLSTDNSVMIALAGHAHIKSAQNCVQLGDIQAQGNLSLS